MGHLKTVIQANVNAHQIDNGVQTDWSRFRWNVKAYQNQYEEFERDLYPGRKNIIVYQVMVYSNVRSQSVSVRFSSFQALCKPLELKKMKSVK